MKSQLPVLEERIVCSDTFLTNVSRGETKPPEGNPWIYFLFITRHVVKQGKNRKLTQTERSVHEVRGTTKEAADDALYEFIHQQNLTLVDDQTGRVVQKDCKENANG